MSAKTLQKKLPIIYLLGPTAAGKTQLALALAQHFPVQLISVDSAMVYHGLDIGTAKPQGGDLAAHRLINICSPQQAYSAGMFRVDALHEISQAQAQGKIPLLVGGTMLYFRVLLDGIATLPSADPQMRTQLEAQANERGWASLHADLVTVDPVSAKRINPNDKQRIQRALEVFHLTGTPLSILHAQAQSPLKGYEVIQLGLDFANRALLHERIAQRFHGMLTAGFVQEVEALYARGDLSSALPAIRSVGYRQCWQYLAGEMTYTDMITQAIAATRQLAKRQMTWLRSWPALNRFEVTDVQVLSKTIRFLEAEIKGYNKKDSVA